MNDIKKRARELLAKSHEADGRYCRAATIRNPNQQMEASDHRALRAVIAALAPPEGYVMVKAATLQGIFEDAEEWAISCERDGDGVDAGCLREVSALLAANKRELK